MVLHSGGDVQVARRRSHRSGVSFPGDPQPRAVPRPRRYPYLHRFRVSHASVASACWTGIPQFAAAAATRTGQVEAHRARHLAHVPRALALRTGHFAGTRGVRARTVTGAAHVVARYVDARLRAADRLPEIDVHHVFEIAALFRLRLPAAASAIEELRKDVPKSPTAAAPRLGPPAGSRARSAGPREKVRKIEPRKVHVGLRTSALLPERPLPRITAVFRIEAELVVHLPLLRIAQNVIGFLNVLEPLLGRLVAGVEVGMVFPRQLAVGLPNLVRRSRLGNAQRFVIVVLGGHGFSCEP